MNPQPISATDAVSPAIETTKWMMFKPFQWSRWWRVGLVGLAAGEMASSGGCGGNFGDLFGALGDRRKGDASTFQYFADNPLKDMDLAAMAGVITLLVVLGLALFLVHLYLGSVCRFILFDGMLTGSFRIRQGFQRWSGEGFQFFLFMLFFQLVMLLALGLVVGVPAAIAYSAGLFKTGANPAGLVAGFLLLLPVLFVMWLAAFCFFVLVKDFAVPIVALEGWPMRAAIARVMEMARTDKGGFAGYLGMKAVLSIAAAVVLGIVGIFVVLLLLVPVIGIVAGGIALGPGMWKTPAGIALIVILVLIFVLVLMTILAILGAPAIIFFQSYVLHFFARRYLPLWNRMYPPPPAPPAIETPPSGSPDENISGGAPPSEPAPAL